MICATALMCHAPIVIPAIAGERSRQCERTTAAMKRVAFRLVDSTPDVLVVVSPHTPRTSRAWGIVIASRLHGDFGHFGRQDVSLELPGAAREAEMLGSALSQRDVAWAPLPDIPLDHGAMVPLHFLQAAGWSGPTLLLAMPGTRGDYAEAAMGEAIASAARASSQRWAVLASGDMSHRLIPGAPAGYDARAHHFDEEFVRALRAKNYRHACSPDPQLRELAAEDVVQSVTVACAAGGWDSVGAQVYDYEGPFGVGYCEAILLDRTQPPKLLLEVARSALRRHLRGDESLGAETRDAAVAAARALQPPWDQARPVFVTLRTSDGQLRGCIGELQPSRRDLVSEVAHFAVAAATSDPRFPPVQLEELDDLKVEISVLDTPQPVASRAQLDPDEFGIVVSADGRRGVLLPEIAGVVTVDQQLRIALNKAGIGVDEPYEIERFRVHKVRD